MPDESPPPEPDPPPMHVCPWCDYTDVMLKKVLNHMESAHRQRCLELALHPPIAEGGPV
jgi:hypothetical protein